ncbi:MAG TPA: DNA mismatch repair endonuclease MutL [Blastocatellia bacterium]|nr:DNA mismatch repair endonuclease MutL [Blastocatellia bacterium]HMZ22358.1 DNA mismatch repair endonuclease MutL [Blastocatellia bacterium]HNG31933.1 DNA mismatch repair endonuclease MutL [Blastocatellia bacterium]
MSKIRVLPDSLANKIAAGEVVERPASIVKELIENSIDAGSHKIEVTIESGGRRLIRISDDGEGMSRDDAILAFERHATSKLKVAEDLEAISTLGFRGEALASIASVAKVRLRTQTADDLVGTEIEISGGRMLHVRDCAFARGAEFEIRDLFFNVPARRKFLKSEATESYHIANLVTHYALANPQLSFTLTNNNRESIRVTPVANLRERAYQLFGGEFIGDLIEVLCDAGEMRVGGYVSSPSATRTNRDSQYFFINGRYVRDKVIGKALSEAYRAMIPSGVYPSAMLMIEMPPHEVDVNVHPAKTEVRFVRSAIVYDLIRDAVRAAIGSSKAAATPFAERKAEPAQPIPAEVSRPTFEEKVPLISREELKAAFRFQAPLPQLPVQEKIKLTPLLSEDFADGSDPVATEQVRLIEEIEETDSETFSDDAPAAEVTALLPAPAPVYGHRIGCLGTRGAESANSQLKPAQNLTLHADEIYPLGQMHNSFIIATDRTGLLLIDQHVAHERILFEQHWRALRRRRIDTQRLLIPETLDLSPAQAATFDQVLPELEKNGFELGRLSGRTIAVKAIPALLGSGMAQSLLVELLDAIEDDRRGLSLDELQAEIAAGLACRAAIKINMPLAPEKMYWLIDELMKMENPATCPHGRPIVLRITIKEIEKGFQRI